MTPPLIASTRGGRLFLAIIGVIALLWPALVNRQPFFFSDTTAYVRAADLAVQMASGGRITTAWSRPRAGAPATSAPAGSTAPPAASAPRGSDGSGGKVMAGRSPYFGALLYAAYVTSGFWLFVVAQALVAWWLIGLALRAFGLDRAEVQAGVAVALAAGTTVAYYNGLLLADALGGFGVLAFLLLATPQVARTRRERAALALVVLVSVVAHLTHIVMLAAMTGVLTLLVLARRLPWREARGAAAFGAAAVVVGLLSVMLVSRVVSAALGQPPALVPLLTARFIADGPGRDFMRAGCEGNRFVVCTLPYDGPNAQAFLWAKQAPTGVFLPADPATRARLSAEDTGFALAVLRAYPVRQGGMMLWNTLLQLVTFDSGTLNQPCLADPACSEDALPPVVREGLRATPSGQARWPVAIVALKDQIVAAAALAAILTLLPALGRAEPATGRRMALWLLLLGGAMLANAFFGGAVSEAQGRYQGPIVWLVPLLGAIVLLRWRGLARRQHARALPVAAARG